MDSDCILLNKDDILDLLIYREGSEHYERAERRVRSDLVKNIEFSTVEWFLLQDKRHYNNEGYIIIVPKIMSDIQIEKVVNKQYNELIKKLKLTNETTGYRWVKYNERNSIWS